MKNFTQDPHAPSNSLSAKWMESALRLAEKAKASDEVPVGAVIIHNGEILAEGFNQREGLGDPTRHAEIIAIQNAASKLGSWRLSDCTLVVTLEPCLMCLAACQQARLQKVLYGATDPKAGAISLGYHLHQDERTNHRFPVELMEHKSCGQILTDFFREKRAKHGD